MNTLISQRNSFPRFSSQVFIALFYTSTSLLHQEIMGYFICFTMFWKNACYLVTLNKLWFGWHKNKHCLSVVYWQNQYSSLWIRSALLPLEPDTGNFGCQFQYHQQDNEGGGAGPDKNSTKLFYWFLLAVFLIRHSFGCYKFLTSLQTCDKVDPDRFCLICWFFCGRWGLGSSYNVIFTDITLAV